MEILTSSQMKKVDEETIERFLPGIELMERAGIMASELILERFGEEKIKAVIFAGPGNNGGDALVVARKLTQKGCNCSVHMLKPAEKFSMDAMKNYQRLGDLMRRSKRLKEFSVGRPDWPEVVEKDLADATLIVDGLFGTGVRGALKGKAAEVVRVINESGVPVVSIDVPSGVDGDSGGVEGGAVIADFTVTIGRPKLGLLFYPGRSFVGGMMVADVGFPPEVVGAHADAMYFLDIDEAAKLLPIRPPNAHKYMCGSLLIVAGSRMYTGAAVLAGEAALRGGCGMVTIAAPEGVRGIIEAAVKEAITVPLSETAQGTVAEPAMDIVNDYLSKSDAIAIGPGLGRDEETDSFIRKLLRDNSKPVVIDADGLNAYEGKGEELGKISSPIVITPHSGELQRILSSRIPSLPIERVKFTRKTATSLGVVVVHKGAPSIIASTDGEVFINHHGNSALATGGSGDVLTGFIGSFLAQGAKPLEAANLGSVLLGRAGELASQEFGMRGVKAGDLPMFGGMAMAELEEA